MVSRSSFVLSVLHLANVATKHFSPTCLPSLSANLLPSQLAAVVQRDVESIDDELLQIAIVLHHQAVEVLAIQAEAGRLGIDAENDKLGDWLHDLVVALDLVVGDLQAGSGGGKGQGSLVGHYDERCQDTLKFRDSGTYQGS